MQLKYLPIVNKNLKEDLCGHFRIYSLVYSSFSFSLLRSLDAVTIKSIQMEDLHESQKNLMKTLVTVAGGVWSMVYQRVIAVFVVLLQLRTSNQRGIGVNRTAVQNRSASNAVLKRPRSSQNYTRRRWAAHLLSLRMNSGLEMIE